MAHTDMLRQNLADIHSYAQGMLDHLEHGAGELPQWTSHIISSVRTHMHDVVHFLREKDRQGRRYGFSHRTGPGTLPPAQMEFSTDSQKHLGRDWAGNAGVQTTSKQFTARRYGVPGRPAGTPGWYGQGGVATVDSGFLAGALRRRYGAVGETGGMARKNLREIAAYAQEAASYLQHGGGIAPAWLEHKLSIGAGHMDGMGHWLENEGIEGRRYGGGRDRHVITQPARRGRFWKKHPHRHVPYHPKHGYLPHLDPNQGARRYAMTPREMVEMQGPMGYLQRPWRSLRPGYGPVQEYGSMGYGSMGTGSMDQSVQQAMLQRTKGAKVP